MSDILSQYVVNTLMLGVIYAMVAVGFTLFFGVLDVIKFSHGDVLMLGGFAALTAYFGAGAVGIEQPRLLIALMLLAAVAVARRRVPLSRAFWFCRSVTRRQSTRCW